MKLKKGILLAVLTFVAVTLIGTFSNVQAAITTREPIELMIQELRSKAKIEYDPITDSEIITGGRGYQLHDVSATAGTYKQIWKIYKTEKSQNESFYCIKGGPGFGSGSSSDMGTGSIKARPYSKYFNLRNKEDIPEAYSKFLPKGTNFNKLMWVLDQCYVVPKIGATDADIKIAEQNKQILLDAVEDFVNSPEKENVYDNTSDWNNKLAENLEDDDIEAIQQLAIWYFTNDDDYHVGDNNRVKDDNDVKRGLNIYVNPTPGEPAGDNYVALEINLDEDAAKLHAMEALFDYLIETAPSNYNYQNNGDDSDPAQIADTNVQFNNTKVQGRIIVGPYKVEQLRDDVEYSLDGIFYDGNGNEIGDVLLVDSNGNPLTEGTTIKSLVGNEFYISIPESTNTSKIKFEIKGSFFNSTITYWAVENPSEADQPIVQVEKENMPFNNSKEYGKAEFDLALRKFITDISRDGKSLTIENIGERVPEVTNSTKRSLSKGEIKTLEKIHIKDALTVKTGDIVTYTIRVYNEGNVDGWATEVTDYLPSGLKYIDNQFNRDFGWTDKGNGKITTDYLASSNKKLLAFDKDTLDLDSEDIKIQCEVVAVESDGDQSLKNIAEITAHKDINGNTQSEGLDRDSETGNVTTDPDKYKPQKPREGIGEQDDDDFEELVLFGKYFDLSLRKFITGVTDSEGKNPRILQSREPKVDTKPLLNGKTTATYSHLKEPVGVSNGDIVTYTIRVYNEGQLDGYVTKITDHLPPQLEYIVDDELNAEYGWEVSKDGRTITTDITSTDTKSSASRDTIYKDRVDEDEDDRVLLKAFNGGKDLDYIDVKVRCKVKDDIKLSEKITNIAEVTAYKAVTDTEETKAVDRDSTQDSLTQDNSKPADDIQNDNLPTDENLPEYKGNADNKFDLSDEDYFYKGQQDDDDFEKLVVQRFDLALRKFITKVNDKDITDRAPVFKIENGKYIYEHTKEPVDVANGNIVIYTLRIFNEGNVPGYATKVKDDLPEGLEFLPEDPTNTAFGWKMYKKSDEEGKEDEVTTNVAEADYVMTDFLKYKETDPNESNLIEAFNPETMTMPAYKNLKIAFKVTEPNTSDRIIINQAQIADDSDAKGNKIDDVDSEPNVWTDGEDDQDIEKIKVKYFDLSLKKWVTESIVTFNGKTTVTQSGHTGDENPEAPMKVEIRKNNINKTTVKFRFNIKVTNEGEIAGYAKELIDYIPQGLKFVAEDNPKWKEVDGKVTTDQLKDTLLQPGESATVDIVLTWINGSDNMGEKVNWAEINKDENEFNAPDIDSTPGNNVKGEDDIDQAPVLLAQSTGTTSTYIGLIITSISMLATGIFLIKKFVI